MDLELGKTSRGGRRRAPPPYLEIPDAPPALAPAFGVILPAAAGSCWVSWPPWWRRAAATRPRVEFKTVSKPPTVQVIKPQVRNIVRVVGQPSFIEAYERTSIFPKLTAYIEEWKVDIGDKVKKDQPLAYLFVPELEEDHKTKKATVELDKERVELARKIVDVADADVKAAEARVEEAKAILDKYQAEVDRWDSEVKRLDHEVKRGIVDPQILLESNNQLKASTAARDAAKATIEKAEAELLSNQATLAKAKVDVKVAEAAWLVAESEEKRLEAWVGYLTLPAPFDGVIVARNANTFDFVLPTTGDPTADERSPHLSPAGSAAPIYVVDRTDIVRIFVDIPEQDANYVQDRHQGDRARQGVPRPADSRHRHAHLLGAQRQEPDAPRRDRPAQPQQPAPAGDVRLRQGDHRAARRAGSAARRPHLQRRESVLLEVRERPCGQDGSPDRRQRRHWIEVTNLQLPVAPDGARIQWAPVNGSETGDPGRPVDPGRRQAPWSLAPRRARRKSPVQLRIVVARRTPNPSRDQ